MLDPRTLTHVQLATIVTDVQKILWQESKPIPDFPREYGDYWNPAKEEDGDMLEQIADVLADADLMPPDFMPVDLTVLAAPPRVLDAIELLWAARILSGLVRVHRNVVPAARENVRIAEAIVDSYADVPDVDPRDQRWTLANKTR
jgi:Fe-S-cluster formation regulator IscX/YfhJ